MPKQPSESSIPTLREIARESGFALSTVSCALQGRPGVSAANAAQIQEVAQRMGWKRNPLVSAWLTHVRTGKAPTNHGVLAYVINYEGGANLLFDDPNRYIHRAYWKGAELRARQRGYRLETFDYRALGGKRLTQILRTRNIHGVVFCPFEKDAPPLEMDWEFFSCAFVGESRPVPPFHCAVNHHFHSITLCIEHLYRLGYRRMGLAIPQGSNHHASGMFLGGYFYSMHLHLGHQPIAPFVTGVDQFTFENFSKWYESEKPDVVVALHAVVRSWLTKLNQRIPQDVSYANLDLPPVDDSAVSVKDAGIYQHPEHIGAAAIDLVTAGIDRNERGIPAVPKSSLIESSWVNGASLKVPAKKRSKKRAR